MLAPAEQPLQQFMPNATLAVHCFADREEAPAELARRRYFAAPVIDSENHILGMINAERMISGAQEDAVGNLQKMFGAAGRVRPTSPFQKSC